MRTLRSRIHIGMEVGIVKSLPFVISILSFHFSHQLMVRGS